MKHLLGLGAICAVATLLAGCGGGATGGIAQLPGTNQTTSSVAVGVVQDDFQAGLASGRFIHVCDAALAGEASCHSILRTDVAASKSPGGNYVGTNPYAGYVPAQLQGAYGIAGGTTGNVVGIVDAYDDPNLESDLAVYRSTFGLPACTTSNGCFRKVNQNGVAGSYPRTNASWAEETSLDVDMVSANCPACKILVVEAKSASLANLGASVDTAAQLGAKAISNSYGGSESSTETSYAAYYYHPGIAVTASSGDSGYGAQQPAAFNTVVATGGTTLNLSGNTRASETVWSGAGSGCSAYIAQQSWQTKVLPKAGCSDRVIADVAYDANPNTGVSVYDSLSYQGYSGWLVFGGTSVASPAISAIYARAGGSALGTTYPASYTYAHIAYGTDLYDVKSGSNGTCTLTYLCTAGTGYDGPTGLGTPIGLGAF